MNTPEQVNRCTTYFRMVGDFDPNEITKKLGLKPFECWKKGMRRHGGSLYTVSAWHFGKCDTYDPDTARQMEQTIRELRGKTELLREIREKYEVSYYLEVVPRLYPGNVTPSLSPSPEVLEFCHATKTLVDIDMYLADE